MSSALLLQGNVGQEFKKDYEAGVYDSDSIEIVREAEASWDGVA